ncbi:hypothetical protein [Rhizobium beringeri]|uniref:hypothetical protein n=1 Tax=Rhizobium beringeri TaxID=3019934 RepID=UPI003B5C9268
MIWQMQGACLFTKNGTRPFYLAECGGRAVAITPAQLSYLLSVDWRALRKPGAGRGFERLLH